METTHPILTRFREAYNLAVREKQVACNVHSYLYRFKAFQSSPRPSLSSRNSGMEITIRAA